MIDIISLLSTDGYIMCNKKLIKLYGGDCAILIGELCAEYNYYKNRGELTPADSFYSTQENIENNTGLNPHYQRKAINILTEAEIITVTKQGMPAKNYFWINQTKLLQLFTGCTTSDSQDAQQVVKNMNLNNNKKKEYINKKDILSLDNIYTEDFLCRANIDKPKKKSLYQQAMDYVDDNIEDLVLRENVKEWINFMFELYREKGKTLYLNVLKSKINRLLTFRPEDRITIVLNAIDNGWQNFYEPKENKSKGKTKFGEDEQIKSKKGEFDSSGEVF